MKRNQSGFTLIEIAIVLVIIGLLLGGVLKGQELINSARVKNIATDFKNIPVYIYGYQDKFRSLPGDDIQAASHVANAVTCAAAANKCALGNGIIDGPWNAVDATNESFLFWQHVRLAGLAPGATDTTQGQAYLPVNASGGIIGIQSGTTTVANSPVIDSAGAAIRGSYIICSTGILGKFVKQLDIQMDDGNTASGSMMALSGTTLGTSATATANIDDAASYTICMGV
ncbi:MAG: prepilin-type N-terminal cleavage/methylation domain-containing protein [Sideroxydans sp.]|jgi:prepilin-type N-terminal cleavage/methylation domain-containing protein